MPENFQNEKTPLPAQAGPAPLDRGENTPLTPLEEGNPVPSQLGRGQKIAVAVLAVFAVFVMGFWATQFKRSITDPLAYKGSQNSDNADTSLDKLTDEELKTRDTDKDGLSDWDELNIYLTSPYLDDSDSDGYKDKEEVDNGNDPNCPVGRECYGVAVSDEEKIEKDTVPEEDNSASNEELLNSLLTESGNQQDANTAGDLTDEQTKALENLLNGKASVSEIREMLSGYGMNQDALDKLSDEQIMEMYQETLLSNNE